MSFTITHTSGAMERDVDQTALASLLAELPTADAEHPDVSVNHDSGWTLSAFGDGRIVLENVEDPGVRPRHLVVDVAQQLTLFALLARGDLEAVERSPWEAGY